MYVKLPIIIMYCFLSVQKQKDSIIYVQAGCIQTLLDATQLNLSKFKDNNSKTQKWKRKYNFFPTILNYTTLYYTALRLVD